ncbi:hypothetical protein CQA69_08770 [Campylobacter estrildidarum]|uniref:Uncharacterized protein n=1 Tax=Campylobacter estrildidarum TaxID=2510189 RepID=A0A4U7BEH2_9BACT|nr:hypothetical protein CQA69_08770 [Campylobacter estrildidarum]
MENKLLELIKQNGNIVSESDFLMLEQRLNIDDNALEICFKQLIEQNKIIPVWVNPSTNLCVSEKDFEHYEIGYSVI